MYQQQHEPTGRGTNGKAKKHVFFHTQELSCRLLLTATSSTFLSTVTVPISRQAVDLLALSGRNSLLFPGMIMRRSPSRSADSLLLCSLIPFSTAQQKKKQRGAWLASFRPSGPATPSPTVLLKSAVVVTLFFFIMQMRKGIKIHKCAQVALQCSRITGILNLKQIYLEKLQSKAFFCFCLGTNQHLISCDKTMRGCCKLPLQPQNKTKTKKKNKQLRV